MAKPSPCWRWTTPLWILWRYARLHTTTVRTRKTHIISELHGRLRGRLELPVIRKHCKHFSLHVGLCLIKYGLGMTVCSLSVCVTEVQEPYAVVVLLEKDLIVVDLTQSKCVRRVSKQSVFSHLILYDRSSLTVNDSTWHHLV